MSALTAAKPLLRLLLRLLLLLEVSRHAVSTRLSKTLQARETLAATFITVSLTRSTTSTAATFLFHTKALSLSLSAPPSSLFLSPGSRSSARPLAASSCHPTAARIYMCGSDMCCCDTPAHHSDRREAAEQRTFRQAGFSV